VSRNLLIWALAIAVNGILAPPACAEVVETIITGVVASGLNGHAPSGIIPAVPGPFGAAGEALDGMPFLLIYVFDSELGTQHSVMCNNGQLLSSSISNNSTSNPGIAVLFIGTGAFLFAPGILDEHAIFSSEFRNTAICGSATHMNASVLVQYGGQSTDTAAGSGYVNTGLVSTSNATFGSPDWTSPLVAVPPTIDVRDSLLAFAIQINSAEPAMRLAASGRLQPQAVIVVHN
jgi:hypothetical protein